MNSLAPNMPTTPQGLQAPRRGFKGPVIHGSPRQVPKILTTLFYQPRGRIGRVQHLRVAALKKTCHPGLSPHGNLCPAFFLCSFLVLAAGCVNRAGNATVGADTAATAPLAAWPQENGQARGARRSAVRVSRVAQPAERAIGTRAPGGANKAAGGAQPAERNLGTREAGGKHKAAGCAPPAPTFGAIAGIYNVGRSPATRADWRGSPKYASRWRSMRSGRSPSRQARH
jgi:hypothetical protein